MGQPNTKLTNVAFKIVVWRPAFVKAERDEQESAIGWALKKYSESTTSTAVVISVYDS
jgi:hypothetical protein